MTNATANPPTLIQLARAEFEEHDPGDGTVQRKLKPLTALELDLCLAAQDARKACGYGIEFSRYNPKTLEQELARTLVNPRSHAKWHPDRTIRSELLLWLCTNKQARELVGKEGIWLEGGRIEGALDLDYAIIPFPIDLTRCAILDKWSIQRARIKHLNFDGTYSQSINLEQAHIEGSIFMRHGFWCDGEINLLQAAIDGSFEGCGGFFLRPEKDREVRGRHAINLDRAIIKGSVFLREKAKTNGTLNLPMARIGGSLELDSSILWNAYGDAIEASNAKIEGNVFLRDEFRSFGGVKFVLAEVGGRFDCEGGHFTGPKEPDHVGRIHALGFDKAKICGDVWLTGGFVAEGEVTLIGAHVGKDLVCERSSLTAPIIGWHGNVSLDRGASLIALGADSARIDGSIRVRRDATVVGGVSLVSASIGGTLMIYSLNSASRLWLDLSGLVVGKLHLGEGKNFSPGSDWPAKGGLDLRGCIYQALDDDMPDDPARLKMLLDLQAPERWSPQPYEQMAKVLKERGHDHEAREILVAKEEERKKLRRKGFIKISGLRWWIWYVALGPLIRYGYHPSSAYRPILLLWGAGSLIFHIGYANELIVPADRLAYVQNSPTEDLQKLYATSGHTLEEEGRLPRNYPAFQSVAYSLDTLVPIVDLQVGRYWTPSAHHGLNTWFLWPCTTGSLLRFYLWFHIVAGWALATLLVAGFTGILKK